MLVGAHLRICAETTTSRCWSHDRDRVRPPISQEQLGQVSRLATTLVCPVSNKGQICTERNSDTTACLKQDFSPLEENTGYGCSFCFSCLCWLDAAAGRRETTRVLPPG